MSKQNIIAIIPPSKSVADLETKSVMKKWKDKSFAAGVNRIVIEKGGSDAGDGIKRSSY
jgi:predicted hydrolase (HD superfamily)